MAIPRHIRLFLVLAAVTLLSSAALPDGGFITYHAERSVIPDQRAIVAYRNGIEKLVIESSFAGHGKDVGWIIPVPAAPNRIEAVSPIFTRLLSTHI
jgi:hypothetical protein